MRLTARLAKLEADSRDRRVIVIWRHYTETDEQAKARWLAEHPGEDLAGAGLKVTIIGWADRDPEPGTPQ
jgi:hypothetical protein